MTDIEAVQKAVDQVVQDFGKLDCFVANAGTAVSKGLLESSVGELGQRPCDRVYADAFCRGRAQADRREL